MTDTTSATPTTTPRKATNRLDAKQMHLLNVYVLDNHERFHGHTYDEIAEICSSALGFAVSPSSVRTAREATETEWRTSRERADVQREDALQSQVTQLQAQIYELNSRVTQLSLRLNELEGTPDIYTATKEPQL